MLFIGDSDRMVVHNLSLETRQCKLNEINVQNRDLFSSLQDAHRQGYESCQYCLGNKNKKGKRAKKERIRRR